MIDLVYDRIWIIFTDFVLKSAPYRPIPGVFALAFEAGFSAYIGMDLLAHWLETDSVLIDLLHEQCLLLHTVYCIPSVALLANGIHP